MQKLVIFEHDGGEMANQLWNHLSVAAYAAERNVPCENWSFYEYPGFFAFRQPNWLVRTLFEPQFVGYRRRKDAFKTRLWRKLYKLLVAFPVRLFSAHILVSTESPEAVRTAVYHLPPAQHPSQHLQELEKHPGVVYIANRGGAVFRNREGIFKHREKLVRMFAPAVSIQQTVDEIFATARTQYKHVVGVHIRQGDYATFKSGKYAIPQARVRQILDEFLAQRGYTKEETRFLIASDGHIETAHFGGLNYSVSTHDVGTDLFTLARCDALIGSDSTLGNFAAYLGNIPHIIMKTDPMDWNYYSDKAVYFPNKYFTIMAY